MMTETLTELIEFHRAARDAQEARRAMYRPDDRDLDGNNIIDRVDLQVQFHARAVTCLEKLAAAPVVGVAEAGVWRETSGADQALSSPLEPGTPPLSD